MAKDYNPWALDPHPQELNPTQPDPQTVEFQAVDVDKRLVIDGDSCSKAVCFR